MKKFYLLILLCFVAATHVHALILVNDVSDDELHAGYEEDLQTYIDAVGSNDNVVSAPIPIAISINDTQKTFENCSEHIKDETSKLNTGYYQSDSIWLQHVFKCKKCCGPLMMSLWGKYNRTVAELGPLVVFFDHGSSIVNNSYHRKLEAFYHNNRNKHFFLVGRASQTGAANRNQELSGERASNVKRHLTDYGVNSSLIEFSFFGEKPPRLNQAVIRLYGINESEYSNIIVRGLSDEERNVHRMNQSVVVVAY